MDRHVTANCDDEFYPFTLNDLASASMKPNDYVDLLERIRADNCRGLLYIPIREHNGEVHIHIHHIYIYKVLPITGHEGPEGQ